METQIVSELRLAVRGVMNSGGKNKSINRLVSEILSEVGIEPTTVLRRDFDGNSQADWLVEKMIGEILISGSTSELPKG